MSGIASLSATKLALLGRQLWSKDGDLLRAEPIAVVGMGCRFPGADSPERLWDLLLEGRDVVQEVPSDRWNIDAWYDEDPATPGRMSTRWGGFLDDVRGFDAARFDISAREAERMDPQQRIALEVACEAVERAGIPLNDLRDSLTGVFFASYHNDYTLLQYSDPETVTSRTLTGALHALVANRISYVLGLRGPSLAIDSACSSSLVATHLACQALRSRDCDVALAGGVSVMATPHVSVALSKGGFMSPTGRCHTFDASADGFVRAEGCGVIVLKRLSDAIAAGDTVLGVIRGSAVNQDGESTTLSAPNGLAQEQLIRSALANAGVSADQVTLVEAHGTGTELGDPIETDALMAVFRGRAAGVAPCWLGAIKSNVGHLEAAAGVAGMIKVMLCMHHGTIPPHALFERLNRHIDLDGGPLRIATVAMPWNAGGSRIAGVSSFGVGGTNAHVVIEEVPTALRQSQQPAAPPWVLPISARSSESLRLLAGAYADRIRNGADTSALCRTAARHRTHFREWRVALASDDSGTLAGQLESISSGARAVQRAPDSPTHLCYVFTGQGSQWPGMASSLRVREPAFAAAFDEARNAIIEAGGPDVALECERPAAGSRLEQTDIAQASIFAVQYAFVRLLEARGIRANAVIGHSSGEIAAAVAAGMFDLAAAARAVVERGRAMQTAFDTGRMVAVRASEPAVRRVLDDNRIDLAIATVNGPSSLVLSGAVASVERVIGVLKTEGIEHTPLDVRFAFHSPLMNDAASALSDAAQSIIGTATDVPLLSTVTAAPLAHIDSNYLAANVRSPVRFAAAVEAALDRGITHFIEIGPHPALGRGIVELGESRGVDARVTYCMHRERDDRITTANVTAELYAWGHDIDWSAVYPGAAPVAAAPTYAWHHVPYWFPDAPEMQRPGAQRHAGSGFPGERISSPALDADVFEIDVRDRAIRALEDHRIGGESRVPATALLELVRAAGERAGLVNAGVRELGILRPLETARASRIQTVLRRRTDDAFSAEIFAAIDDAWEQIATAELVGAGSGSVPRHVVEPNQRTEIEPEDFRELLVRLGCDFGDGFRLLRSLAADATSAEGVIAQPSSDWRGGLHPAVTDAAAQLCIAVLHRRGLTSDGDAFLPWSAASYGVVDGLRATRGMCQLVESDRESATFNVALFDGAGVEVAYIDGWRLRRTPTTSLLRSLSWDAEARGVEAAVGAERRWVVVSDGSGMAERAATELAARGRQAVVVSAERAATGILDDHAHLEGVLCFACADDDSQDPAARAAAYARTLLEVARPLSVQSRSGTRVLLVTRATQSVGPAHRASAAGAAPRGVVAALRAESPALRCTCLDLDASMTGSEMDAHDARTVVDEALTAEPADDIAYRDGVRYVARDVLVSNRSVVVSNAAPSTLVHRSPGTLEAFELEAVDVADPPAGHVRIRVSAAGVNFRDVLTALGSYPGATAMGHECCGIVDAVGHGVNGRAAGDRVIAFWPGCFGTYVNVPASFVFDAPARIDPAGAATIPVAFGTAFYALHNLGRLESGQSVLIHAGAGGVGMAAIQLARAAGTRVFATAGSPMKRSLLETLGAVAFDSRSPAFADDVLRATDGRGVDIVLNSLIGEMIPAGLRSLAPGGLFIELGKREILSAADVAAHRSDVRYIAFDLGDVARADETILPAIFDQLTAMLKAGSIRPLPVSVHAMAEAGTAFRRMARAEHVGKVVLVPPRSATAALEGWVVVTGGSGGVGMAVSRWLSARGARHIALWSRRGADTEQARDLETLRAAGSDVRTMMVDVTSLDSVSDALNQLRRSAPITAIIHAAAVIDDATLPQMDDVRLSNVLAPKVEGAWNLHVATQTDAIEAFVLCSAAGSLIDAAGQANYAAANAFVDAFALYRRGLGLPAVSVLWGPWSDAGMAARLDDTRKQRWTRRGLDWWNADNARAALDALLTDVPAQVLAVRRSAGGSSARPVRAVTAADAALRTRLGSVAPAMRRPMLAAHVTEVLTSVLGCAVAPSADTPLRDAGLDSLGAIELRNALTLAVGIPLPATLAFDRPTINAMTDFLMHELDPDSISAPAAETGTTDTEAAIASMTDEEAETLLMRELGLDSLIEAQS